MFPHICIYLKKVSELDGRRGVSSHVSTRSERGEEQVPVLPVLWIKSSFSKPDCRSSDCQALSPPLSLCLTAVLHPGWELMLFLKLLVLDIFYAVALASASFSARPLSQSSYAHTEDDAAVLFFWLPSFGLRRRLFGATLRLPASTGVCHCRVGWAGAG